MAVERISENKFEALLQISRDDFGPGYIGEKSYQIILSGAGCEAFIDENKTKCNLPSIGTADIDVRDDLEFFPFCSPEHQMLVQSQVLDELNDQGRYSVPAMNGFGREYDKSPELYIIFQSEET